MNSKVPATALPQHSPEQVKCGASELLLMWTFSLYKCLQIIHHLSHAYREPTFKSQTQHMQPFSPYEQKTPLKYGVFVINSLSQF